LSGLVGGPGLVDFPMSRLGRQWVSAIAPELMRVHF
jgi:hypothetical protein